MPAPRISNTVAELQARGEEERIEIVTPKPPRTIRSTRSQLSNSTGPPTTVIDRITAALQNIENQLCKVDTNTTSTVQTLEGPLLAKTIEQSIRNAINSVFWEETRAIIRQEIKETVQQEIQNALKQVDLDNRQNRTYQNQPTYAQVAQTPKSSDQPNREVFSCIIDTTEVPIEKREQATPGPLRKAIEEEVQKDRTQHGWKCVAATKPFGKSGKVKIIGRNDADIQKVEQAVPKIPIQGLRILPKLAHRVRIDNVNRTAILDEAGRVRDNAIEAIRRENGVKAIKLAWLSNKDNGKAYGSMVLYIQERSEATRLLEGQYLNIKGESAYVRTFEERMGPTQCYNCQELRHKAWECKKEQKCSRCAEPGHRYTECTSEAQKCVRCSGPHGSNSKACRMRSIDTDA